MPCEAHAAIPIEHELLGQPIVLLDGLQVAQQPHFGQVLERGQVGDDLIAELEGGFMTREAFEEADDALDRSHLVFLVGVEFELKSCRHRFNCRLCLLSAPACANSSIRPPGGHDDFSHVIFQRAECRKACSDEKSSINSATRRVCWPTGMCAYAARVDRWHAADNRGALLLDPAATLALRAAAGPASLETPHSQRRV